MKRISLISIAIIVALAVSLAGVMVITDSQPMTAQAAETDTLYTAEYTGENGTTAQHLGVSMIAEKYGVSTTAVMGIRNGTELYNFLNGGSYNYAIGYLTTNVYLAYNTSISGYDTVNVNSSAAIFAPGRVLDGNGYEINIYGGAGEANSTTEIQDNYDYRANYRKQGGRYDTSDVWYEYTGYLVAQNYGTIKDCTINYTSAHSKVEGGQGDASGKDDVLNLGKDTVSRLLSKRAGIFTLGIVAGLNGYDGVIDNVRLNVKSPMVAIKQPGADGKYASNGCYAGAIAGRAEDNSLVNNCWVDLASGTSVNAGTTGKKKNLPTDDAAIVAVAGGIIGHMDAGTGKITYCALTGSGEVGAMGSRASKEGFFKMYAGGVTGGCSQISGNTTMEDGYSTDEPQMKYGQIQGILSSWTGTRFTNIDNTPRATVGSLFGVVGTDDNILSVALLYSFETLMNNNVGKGFCQAEYFKASDGKLVLDSAMKFKNWVEINPTTDGGYMTAQFDRDDPTYDIRVHIVADGHDDFSESDMDAVNLSGSRYYQFKMSEGDGGNFIWSGSFASANDTSNHISLILDDPIYAEIYMISSTNTGKYNYEFGRMGNLEYVDINGENGKLVKPYNGSAAPLQLPEVRMTNHASFDTSVFQSESLWNITRSNKKVALSQAYMPGTYRMKLETKLGERTYGYYDEAQRMLAWQPKSDYLFTILQGEINCSYTAIDGWQEEVTFQLQMNNENDVDWFEFQRNGVFPEKSRIEKDGANATYTVNSITLPEGTGKNGTSYTFYAYKQDAVTNEAVAVAVSSSVTIRIDNQAPEVSEIEYYMVEEDGSERLLYEEDLDYIAEHWTKNQILAKFSVTDNGKSGIAIAATETFIEETILTGDGDRDVIVTINDSTPISLAYADARGNTTTVDIQLNVDRVQGRLFFSGATYRPTGRFNYSTKSVPVRYTAYFGSSDWRLYYSYQKDAQGNDIWIASPDYLKNSGALKTLTIDWNMGDIRSGEGDDFKIKMVNETGLYEDEVIPLDAEGNYLEVDEDHTGKIGNFIIWLRVANIYIDNSLNNIYVNDNGTVKTVEEILQNEEDKVRFFDKQYDGTDAYEGKKEYKFYTDLSQLNDEGFYADSKVGVIYSPSGRFLRLPIDIGDNGIVPVELVYATTDAGDTKLSFRAVLEGTDNFNYIVYFTDLASVLEGLEEIEDFGNLVEDDIEKYSETFEIDAKINKVEITIELGDQEAFNSDKIYYYGDEVPAAIEVFIEQTGEYITLQINTQASSSANIGDYSIKGIAPNGYKNIDYIVNSTTITIQQRHVAVDLRFDGGEIGNIPTGIKAGRKHAITGTYTDVNGEIKNAVVEYVLNDKSVTALGEVGLYTVNITLLDNNYVIDGQTSFKFNIARGQLEIEMGLRVKDFTEGNVEYNLIIPEESKDLYEESDLQVTYYKYLDGATYNESAGRIEGKISDEPMTEYPTERGYYNVKVEFVTTENPNFFAKKDYAEGYLVIKSAKTQVNVEKTVLEYYYTSEKFTFDLVDAVTEVRSSSNKQLWSASFPAEGVVKVQYRDSDGTYKDVAPNPNQGGGWYSETGRYEYRVTYLGNADYEDSSVNVVMIVNQSELKGITFNPVEVIYDGNNHLPTANGLLNYSDIKVTFQYGTSIVSAEGVNANEVMKQRYNFTDVGEYTMYMTVDKSGYVSKELQTKVIIKKAKMENVTATLVDVEYDGQPHSISFVGITYENGAYRYKGEVVTLKSGSNTEGNSYAINVRYEEGVGPSYYSGEVTLMSPNYEDLVLKTNITIRQALLPYQEIGNTLQNKLPSGFDLSEQKGYYVDQNGNRVECDLQYIDRNGNVVELDEEGKIADGRYTVMLVITDNNYYLDRYWNLEIGEINNASLSVYGIAAIAAVGALMLGAVITAIVVVNKRKKAGIA